MQDIERDREIGVLLDLDGTIVDSMVPLRDAFISSSSKIGLTIDESHQRRIGEALGTIMSGRPTMFSEPRLVWRIGRTLELPFWRRVMLLFAVYPKLRRTAREAPPVKGVVEALQLLKNYPEVKLALVTSRSRKDALAKLRSFGILDKFDAIVTKDDTRSFKPSSEQVKLASKLLKLPSHRCILVGDMPTDVDAAKGAGALAAIVITGIFYEAARSREPDMIIKNLAELSNSLEKILNRLYEGING